MLTLTGKQLLALEAYANGSAHLIHLTTLKSIVRKGIGIEQARRIVEYSYTKRWHGGRIDLKANYSIPEGI